MAFSFAGLAVGCDRPNGRHVPHHVRLGAKLNFALIATPENSYPEPSEVVTTIPLCDDFRHERRSAIQDHRYLARLALRGCGRGCRFSSVNRGGLSMIRAIKCTSPLDLGQRVRLDDRVVRQFSLLMGNFQ